MGSCAKCVVLLPTQGRGCNYMVLYGEMSGESTYSEHLCDSAVRAHVATLMRGVAGWGAV